MRLFFLLSKENLSLAKEEALAIAKTKGTLKDNLLFLETNRKIKDFERLAYTKRIYEFLFKCKLNDLKEVMEEFDWSKIYEKNFCLRIYGDKRLKEAELAGYIWNKVKNPKVNLGNPKTLIEIYIFNNQAFAGKLLFENKEEFNKRKTKFRPAQHPTTMNPKLARACVNLAGIEKGTLLDPFCGSGGILIEAGLLGYNIIGYDLEEGLLRKARINLDYYKIKNYRFEKKDSTKSLVKSDCIVTDLPYGMSSRVKNIEKTYSNFLKLSYNKTKNMVVIFPDFINHKKLLGRWEIKKTFDIYVHRSLTRKIVVLEK